jgi:2-alkyl-3-oxoalkanoate reductase
LDAAAVGEAVARTEPGAIVHPMTALADMSSRRNFDKTFATTNALRTEGVDHLLAATRVTGATHHRAELHRLDEPTHRDRSAH